MKIYISGKITGTNDYMERFERAEHELTLRGFEVVNPAKENVHFPEGTPWKTYMAESLRLLLYCDAIYMLEGWQNSRGATLELQVAQRTDMQIFGHFEPLERREPAPTIDTRLKLCYNTDKEEAEAYEH